MTRRSWRVIAIVVVVALLIVLLYPQLQDFGAELYRFFN